MSAASLIAWTVRLSSPCSRASRSAAIWMVRRVASFLRSLGLSGERPDAGWARVRDRDGGTSVDVPARSSAVRVGWEGAWTMTALSAFDALTAKNARTVQDL